MTLRELCLAQTTLVEKEICLLEQLAQTLHLTADLSQGDAFIDCLDSSGHAFVVAHAAPQFAPSKYTADVLGLLALPANEPAVYQALAQGVPFHDIVANTQEEKSVAQDVTPIKNESGAVIAVLIAEHDITHEITLERKVEALCDDWRKRPHDDLPESSLDRRETYHRVKNHLQILSGVCSIKARAAQQEETRLRLTEVAGLIKSISSLQALFTDVHQIGGSEVALQPLLEKILRDLGEITSENGHILFHLDCDSILLRHEVAVTVIIIINELIANAIEHGLPPSGGEIWLEVRRGIRFGTVCLRDNGIGLAKDIVPGTGLSIVHSMVLERLKGEFYLDSGGEGTKAIFSFLL